MTLQTFTLSDTESGFYAEQLALLQKISLYNEAVDNLTQVINQQASNTDQDSREEAILTAEVAKFQAESDYLQAGYTLYDKIDELQSFGSGDPQFVVALIPDRNVHENSSDVILAYA